MVRKQQGFTLIELVVVIVILGILAATALPKFVDLSTEAGNAASNGVAGALASSSSVNYAAKVAGKTGTIAVNIANVCDVTVAGNLVTGVSFVAVAPTTNNQYEITGTGDCTAGGVAVAAGTAVTCTITGFKGSGQTAKLICSG